MELYIDSVDQEAPNYVNSTTEDTPTKNPPKTVNFINITVVTEWPHGVQLHTTLHMHCVHTSPTVKAFCVVSIIESVITPSEPFCFNSNLHPSGQLYIINFFDSV